MKQTPKAMGLDRSRITPEMIDAGVAALRASGKLWANSSSDDLTVKEILVAAQSVRATVITKDLTKKT